MDISTTEILLNNLDKLSKHNGLSQTEMARKCCLAQKTVNNLFRSTVTETTPKIDTVEKIAKAFHLTVAELLSPDMTLTEPFKGNSSNELHEMLGNLIDNFLSLDSRGQSAVLITVKRESERMQQGTDK